jgi:hypothetical protein
MLIYSTCIVYTTKPKLALSRRRCSQVRELLSEASISLADHPALVELIREVETALRKLPESVVDPGPVKGLLRDMRFTLTVGGKNQGIGIFSSPFFFFLRECAEHSLCFDALTRHGLNPWFLRFLLLREKYHVYIYIYFSHESRG